MMKAVNDNWKDVERATTARNVCDPDEDQVSRNSSACE